MNENMEVMDSAIDSEWDEPAAEPETPGVEAPADQQELPQAQAAQDPPQQEQPKADPPELFTLKNRDETRQVTREELVAMAQKGWDYDNVRQERDQLRQYRQEADPALALVKAYAERSGMDVAAYLDFCRKQELMAGGMTEEAAKEKVSMEKERAAIDAQRAELRAQQEQRDAAARQQQERARARRKDIEAFFTAYPGVDPKAIPQEVWGAVQKGDTLTNAYTMYENRRLSAELAAERQNKANQAKAPGSLGGNSVTEADEIDRLWAEDD